MQGVGCRIPDLSNRPTRNGVALAQRSTSPRSKQLQGAEGVAAKAIVPVATRLWTQVEHAALKARDVM